MPIHTNIIIDFFNRGGPVMWPILVAFITACAVVLERTLWWIGESDPTVPRQLDEVFQDISAGRFLSAIDRTAIPGNPFARTVHAGLMQAHSSLTGAMQLQAGRELERGERLQWVLGTLITLAPLLGLMGTVTGIMGSFHSVGQDQLAASKVSGGISEALIATACGLGIAILCLIPFNYFNRRLARLRGELERAINHVELLAASARHQGHDLGAFARDHQAGAGHAH